jgi:hypothetical protein
MKLARLCVLLLVFLWVPRQANANVAVLHEEPLAKMACLLTLATRLSSANRTPLGGGSGSARLRLKIGRSLSHAASMKEVHIGLPEFTDDLFDCVPLNHYPASYFISNSNIL